MLDTKLTDKIIEYIKAEPRTIQEISKHINKSWVTTEKYINSIKNDTNLINIKLLRPGSYSSIKLVYYNILETSSLDDLKNYLFEKIKVGRFKSDFDVLEMYTIIDDNKKNAFYEEQSSNTIEKQQLVSLLRSCHQNLFIFSGNLSFINLIEKNTKIIDVLEELLKNKISIKILTRVNFATINNIKKIDYLTKKHPNYIEIRHCYQPLRGFIIDDKIIRLKDTVDESVYKKGEINKTINFYYNIYDEKWISWLQKTFWFFYRLSTDYRQILKEINKIK